MEKLNVAIADDNERMVQLLDEIVASDKDLQVLVRQRTGSKHMRLSNINSRMLFYWI